MLSHARMKHIEIQYHYIREKVLSGEIDLVYVHTKSQIADMLTKGLSKPILSEFVTQLGVKKHDVEREFVG